MNILQNIIEVYRIIVFIFGSISATIMTFHILTMFISLYEPKNKFMDVLEDINCAFSRSTSDFDEHWCWWSGKKEDPQFQMTHCSCCGEYIMSNSLCNNLPENIMCKCNNYQTKNNRIDNYSDDDIFMYDADY